MSEQRRSVCRQAVNANAGTQHYKRMVFPTERADVPEVPVLWTRSATVSCLVWRVICSRRRVSNETIEFGGRQRNSWRQAAKQNSC